MLVDGVRMRSSCCTWRHGSCVFCKSVKRTLLPWQIMGIGLPYTTLVGFFKSTIRQKILEECQQSRELSQVFLGRKKENIDIVDPNLRMNDIFASF